MSPSLEAEMLEEPEFKWGKKRGIGGRKSDVQFYESFTYDGLDYSLYDCVYMHKQGEREPYVGKLVKIWENADKSKKIKVQWFFRPSEITYYLRDAEILENELFFASGDGIGLANINPLEAIAGKCNVVCISTDSRNPQPSAEELRMADYVFYRIFDVKSCTISDQMDDTVGGLKVKFVFNRAESVGTLDVPTLVSNSKDEARNVIAWEETPKLLGNNSTQQLNNLKWHENGNPVLEKEGTDLKQVQVNLESLLGDYSAGVDVNANKDRETTGTILGAENVGCGVSTEKDKVKDKKTLINQVQVEKRMSSARSPCDLDDTPLKRVKFDGPSSSSKGRERPSTGNVVSHNETARLSTTNVPHEAPKSGSNKDHEGSGQSAKLVKSASASFKRPLDTSTRLSKEKSNTRHDACHENKDAILDNDSCSMEGGLSKKGKYDDSLKISKDNNNNSSVKFKEKTSLGETKNSPKLAISHDKKEKSRLGEGSSNENHNDKVGKLSNDNLPNLLITTTDGGGKNVEGRIFEVTRRPIAEKGNWMKLPWEEKMKTAHDQGRLVLLQNLDPEYTSGEVQDIISSAFDENCTARMVQHTATSSPHSGQAFVIFKSREAVDRVVKKLDDECLMLPNQRPLVVCTGVFPHFSEKRTTFVGHLAIDKARRQVQREMKEAVSTSHYSQNNTIEYEMAMAWCLLQSKSDKWWEKLYEQQGKELKKLVGALKSK